MNAEFLYNYYSGTSGLVLPFPNKTHYPEEFQTKSRLEFYASLNTSIEINSSFYKIPQISTLRKWTALVPAEFSFTFKLWKGITHNKGLVFRDEDVLAFMQAVSGVGESKGCLLIQLPPSMTSREMGQLERLILRVQAARSAALLSPGASAADGILPPANISPGSAAWTIAVEFRHLSWYKEGVYDLLAELNTILVLHDKTDAPFSQFDLLGETVYLRFHGPDGNYRGTYTDDFLYEYAGYIRDWISEGKQVYVYFNNTMGEAVSNLQSLNRYVMNADS